MFDQLGKEPTAELETQMRKFEKLMAHVIVPMAEGLLDDVDVKMRETNQGMPFQVGRMVVAEFRARVLGEMLKPYSHPATWWDAVKERFFPDWLKRRFPVNYRTFDVRVVYPGFHAAKDAVVMLEAKDGYYRSRYTGLNTPTYCPECGHNFIRDRFIHFYREDEDDG